MKRSSPSPFSPQNLRLTAIVLFLISFPCIAPSCLIIPHGGVAVAALTENDPDQKEWVQLFNGKELKGWDVKMVLVQTL